MLSITVLGNEHFNEETSEFITVGDVHLELEHSLVSLSKWEVIWEVPFLGQAEKTSEQIESYIKCMCLTPNIPPEVFSKLSRANYEEINTYINAKMTATWFRELPGQRGSSETITAELVYYWMVALTIPFECQEWHLNKLFTLIKVCGQKNQPAKKMGRREAMAQQRSLNAQRRQQFGTSG